jgi:hypothetical protein
MTMIMSMIYLGGVVLLLWTPNNTNRVGGRWIFPRYETTTSGHFPFLLDFARHDEENC